MKTIGIFTGSWGHASIAQAIAEKITQEASDQYQVKIFGQTENLDILSLTYNSMYRISPAALGPTFRLGTKLAQQDKSTRKLLENYFLLAFEKMVRNFVKKYKIDLCISTYFEFNPSLEKLQQEGIPFINIVTDPKVVFSLVISKKAAVNLVFDEQLMRQNKGIRMLPAGWFVRNQFEQDFNQQKIRQKLKLTDQLTFLIASGSEGANAVLKILPTIINCEQKVNFIIACGKNDFLYHNILGIKKSLQKYSSSQAKVIPLAYTPHLHLYMQAADLVVGKAGPNTIFESVACETAFFAITHLHGQEDGNLDLIKDYHIGFVEENAKKANQKLSKLLANPQEIKQFTPSIQRLKTYNQHAIKVLLAEIEKLI